MARAFPVTSVTLISKIRDLGPEADAEQWVRFWDRYSLAIRRFAALKGGEEHADDIVMQVLGKLVDVLREGRYKPEKGKFHSYLAAMIVNEVRMQHRHDLSRAEDRKVSLDEGHDAEGGEGERTLGETLAVPDVLPERLDEDWRQSVLRSAMDYALTKTALSDRDRKVYRAYALEGRGVAEVANMFGISRNYVSQIRVRIDRRIVSVGRELIRGEC